jgi:stearoyl-CoA desaturase (delta-9 desaturase)
MERPPSVSTLPLSEALPISVEHSLEPSLPLPLADDPSPVLVDSAPKAEPYAVAVEEADRWKLGLEWPATIWIASIHLGALAAPFCFSWEGLGVALVLSWVTGGLGICLGFHRLLTHGSFETYRPLKWFFTTMGTLAGEGPPIMWVAAHRKHHIHSDQDEDPHTPMHGGWWSHVLWMLPKHETRYWSEMYRRYAPDMLNDKFVRFLNRNFLWLQLGMGLLLFATGWLIGGVPLGVSFLVYGLFVRSIYVLHVTWFVNSASHIWGYQNYETDDNSRNLWWVGLLAFGEGWHNNHHADQRRARHGHRWWELDLTYAVVWSMERLGLAWNVVKKPSVKAANAVLESGAASQPQK